MTKSPRRRSSGRPATPIEMVESELEGVRKWVQHLLDHQSDYPEAWARGMLSHYEPRLRELEARLAELHEQEHRDEDQ